jgi:hypothetical protein
LKLIGADYTLITTKLMEVRSKIFAKTWHKEAIYPKLGSSVAILIREASQKANSMCF